jgi:peroxiredoxin Q/BCP
MHSDQDGNKVSSAGLKGQRYALYFYPNDDTETCTKQACNLRDNYAALKKAGIKIIGVSHAPVESKKKFADKYKLPFTLLADTDLTIVKNMVFMVKSYLWGELLPQFIVSPF